MIVTSNVVAPDPIRMGDMESGKLYRVVKGESSGDVVYMTHRNSVANLSDPLTGHSWSDVSEGRGCLVQLLPAGASITLTQE